MIRLVERLRSKTQCKSRGAVSAGKKRGAQSDFDYNDRSSFKRLSSREEQARETLYNDLFATDYTGARRKRV